MKLATCLSCIVLVFTFVVAQTNADDCLDCTKQVDGVRLVDKSSCTTYFQCSNGVPILRSCRNGLYFDDRLRICNYAALVDCQRTTNKPSDIVFVNHTITDTTNSNGSNSDGSNNNGSNTNGSSGCVTQAPPCNCNSNNNNNGNNNNNNNNNYNTPCQNIVTDCRTYPVTPCPVTSNPNQQPCYNTKSPSCDDDVVTQCPHHGHGHSNIIVVCDCKTPCTTTTVATTTVAPTTTTTVAATTTTVAGGRRRFIPHKRNTRKFLENVNGRWKTRKCQRGQTFNPLTSACE